MAYMGFPLASLSSTQEGFSNMANAVRATRTYRTAGDTGSLQTADANGTSRINAAGGTGFSSWPMGKVLV